MSIYLACAVIIFAISTFLVFHCAYEDGLIGRIALAVLALSEFVVILEWLNDDPTSIAPTTEAVQVGVALFLTRHVYRFLRWSKKGDFDWNVKK